MHAEVPVSFSLPTGPDFSIYNAAMMRGSQVLCTTSLLPFQMKPVPMCTIDMGQEEQVKEHCLAQEYNMQAFMGLKLTTLGL